MIDNFVGGYLNFLCIFLFLLFFNPVVSLIALAGAFASFLCLLLVSKHSVKHAPAEAEAGRNLAGAVLEYARGISVVKSFGKSGASMEAMQRRAATAGTSASPLSGALRLQTVCICSP